MGNVCECELYAELFAFDLFSIELSFFVYFIYLIFLALFYFCFEFKNYFVCIFQKYASEFIGVVCVILWSAFELLLNCAIIYKDRPFVKTYTNFFMLFLGKQQHMSYTNLNGECNQKYCEEKRTNACKTTHPM